MFDGVLIEPGDFIYADFDGVVRIPKALLGEVAQWLQSRGNAEELIKAMVQNGSTVQDAFQKHRRT